MIAFGRPAKLFFSVKPAVDADSSVMHAAGWNRATALKFAVLFCAYLALYQFSNIFHTTELRATPWNPEAGVAVAAGALFGWASLPVIMLAGLAGNVLWGPPLTLGWNLVSAVAQALIFTGAAASLRSLLAGLRHPTTRTALLFLGFAMAVTAASAAIRLLITMLAYEISAAYLAPYIFATSVGNLVGIIIVSPMFFAFGRFNELTAHLATWGAYQWLSIAAIIPVSFVVFGLENTDEFKFFYLIFLPVIALAVKDGFPGSAIAVLLSDLTMIATLFWRDFEPSTAAELQVLMISLSAVGLILGSVVSERQRIARALDESHARYQESEAALMQASRISLASEMAAALAHEINQPLSSIRNFVRSARRKLEAQHSDSESVMADIDAAVLQVDNAAALIKNTRQFLERGDVLMTPLDARALIETCIELVAPEFRSSGISIAARMPRLLPGITGNKTKLQQVILSLLRNAREAILGGKPDMRKVSIEASIKSRPGFLEISVIDTGPGITDEVQEMLFKPLKSSKGEGLGLGLSLCNTIITSHGGEIWHDDGYGPGARFSFTIPLAHRRNADS